MPQTYISQARMLARIVGFKAVFAAQFPVGFLGNGFAQHLTPAFVFNGTQGFDACRRCLLAAALV